MVTVLDHVLYDLKQSRASAEESRQYKKAEELTKRLNLSSKIIQG